MGHIAYVYKKPTKNYKIFTFSKTAFSVPFFMPSIRKVSSLAISSNIFNIVASRSGSIWRTLRSDDVKNWGLKLFLYPLAAPMNFRINFSRFSYRQLWRKSNWKNVFTFYDMEYINEKPLLIIKSKSRRRNIPWLIIGCFCSPELTNGFIES